jgi:hypothetical protein
MIRSFRLGHIANLARFYCTDGNDICRCQELTGCESRLPGQRDKVVGSWVFAVDDPVWDPSTFSKNRERVLNEDFAACFLDAVLNADRVKGLVSSEHFSVDGTLIQAWASMKS